MGEYNKQVLSTLKETDLGMLAVYGLRSKDYNFTMDVVFTTREKAERENREFLGNRYDVIEIWLS